MIEGQYLYYGDDFKDIYYLRELLSISTNNIKPFQNQCENEDKAFDYNEGIFAIIYVEGQPKGMGRLLFDGSECFIDEVIMQSTLERDLYYDFLIRMLIDKAFLLNSKEIKATVLSLEYPIYMKIGFKVLEAKLDEHEQEWLLLELNPASMRKACSVYDESLMI